MFEPLTEREQQVLSMLVVGEANKEIARSLGISEDTVKHHVSDILRKLGVPNRAAAAAWYVGHRNQE